MQISIGIGIGAGAQQRAAAVVVGPTSQVTMTPTTSTVSAASPTATVFAVARDAALHPTGVAVTYASSNPSAVTAHATTGVITFVAAGSASITATAAGFTSNACVVTAIGVTSQVVLTPSTVSLAAGATTTVAAVAKDAAGHLTGDAVTFASSAPSVVSVHPTSGLCTWHTSGSATITASVGAITSNSCVITAAAGATTQVVMSPTTASLPAGGTVTVTAIAEDAVGTPTGAAVTYQSSNTSVATVNGSGVITWVAAGTVSITATAAGFTSNSCTVTAAAHGPTVQIVRFPTSVSPATGATGTLTKTPEDANAVSTGITSYWHSSDPTKLRIDDAVTGAWTWLGSVGQTAYAYADPNPPAGEPAYTGAVGQTLILADSFDGYVSATDMGKFPYSGGDPYGPLRFIPDPAPIINAPVNTAFVEVVSPGRNGVTGQKLRGHFLASADHTAAIGTFAWRTYPLDAGGATAAPLGTHAVSFWSNYNVPSGHTKYKVFEAWHSGANPSRLQFNTFWDNEFGFGNSTWGIHDNSYTPTIEDMQQPVRPIPEDIYPIGWHRRTYRMRCHTANAGTMTYQPQVIHATFVSDQTGVLVNGNVINVPGFDPAVKWTVSAFAGTTATLTRGGSGTVVAWSGGLNNNGNPSPTQITSIKGVFPVSQTGVVANGDYIALNNDDGFGSSYIVSALAGDGLSCTLTKYSTDRDCSPRLEDALAHNFSSNVNHTGCAEAWVNGTKIIDIQAGTIGQTPAGGVHAWCTRGVLSTLSVNVGFIHMYMGGSNTDFFTDWYEEHDDFTWWME